MALPSLTLVRRLKAPPSKVYAAFTDPALIVQWWGPDAGPCLEAEADVRVGGRFRMVFETLDGQRHEMGGVYREIQPNRRLVYTHVWTRTPEQESVVTIDFVAIAEGTELTVHHAQLPDEPTRDDHAAGWSGMLDKLPALLLETSPERTDHA